jgi:hypothetical protein
MSDEQIGEERWRALAEEAFSLSRSLSDPTAQRIMLRIAQAYAALADRANFQSEQHKNPKRS